MYLVRLPSRPLAAGLLCQQTGGDRVKISVSVDNGDLCLDGHTHVKPYSDVHSRQTKCGGKLIKLTLSDNSVGVVASSSGI